jgi:hypothetical protein
MIAECAKTRKVVHRVSEDQATRGGTEHRGKHQSDFADPVLHSGRPFEIVRAVDEGKQLLYFSVRVKSFAGGVNVIR